MSPRPASSTPDRIIAAAAIAFAAEGFARARLADIAEVAGIRRPSLLYHFPTKEILYQRVVERTLTTAGEALQAAMVVDRPFDEVLDALVAAWGGYLAAHPHHAQILVREVLQPDGPGNEVLSEQLPALLHTVVAFASAAGGEALRADVPVKAAILQIASSALLRHATSPALHARVWGDTEVEVEISMARTLLLR
jgi:AcrR family transcriptional regulator